MTLIDLLDFLFYLDKKETEDKLFDIWLHKDIDKPFEKFRDEVFESAKSKRISKQEEEDALAFAQQILSQPIELG